MQINHRFSPQNAQEERLLKAIEAAAIILEDRLNLKDRNLTLQAQRQAGWAGADAFHAGMYQDEERLIKINFRNLYGAKLSTIITVLAHEFRHSVQYATSIYDGYRWNNQIIVERDYFNKPQEIDARQFQDQYAQIVFNDARWAEFVNDLDLTTGQTIYKCDWTATYAQTGFDREGIKLFRLKNEPEKTFWMHHSQIGEKKWTKKLQQSVFEDYLDALKTQELVKVMTPVTIDDLVS